MGFGPIEEKDRGETHSHPQTRSSLRGIPLILGLRIRDLWGEEIVFPSMRFWQSPFNIPTNFNELLEIVVFGWGTEQ